MGVPGKADYPTWRIPGQRDPVSKKQNGGQQLRTDTQGCPLASTYADTHIHIKPHVCLHRETGRRREKLREGKGEKQEDSCSGPRKANS